MWWLQTDIYTLFEREGLVSYNEKNEPTSLHISSSSGALELTLSLDKVQDAFQFDSAYELSLSLKEVLDLDPTQRLQQFQEWVFSGKELIQISQDHITKEESLVEDDVAYDEEVSDLFFSVIKQIEKGEHTQSDISRSIWCLLELAKRRKSRKSSYSETNKFIKEGINQHEHGDFVKRVQKNYKSNKIMYTHIADLLKDVKEDLVAKQKERSTINEEALADESTVTLESLIPQKTIEEMFTGRIQLVLSGDYAHSDLRRIVSHLLNLSERPSKTLAMSPEIKQIISLWIDQYRFWWFVWRIHKIDQTDPSVFSQLARYLYEYQCEYIREI